MNDYIEDGGIERVTALLGAEDALCAIGLTELDALCVTGIVEGGERPRAVEVAVTYGGENIRRAAGEIVNCLASRIGA